MRNERSLCARINREEAYRNQLQERVGMTVEMARRTARSPLVSDPSRTAPTKADIELTGTETVGVSVKVSRNFEVDQRTLGSLVTHLELVSGYRTPDEVVAALQLMVGEFGDTKWPRHLPIRGGGNNRPRLGAADVALYRPDQRVALEEWLTCGLPEITRFVFGQGSTVAGHAEYIWRYDGVANDSMVGVDDLVSGVEKWLAAGNRVRIEEHKSAISLPFGSLTAAAASPRVAVQGDFERILAMGARVR